MDIKAFNEKHGQMLDTIREKVEHDKNGTPTEPLHPDEVWQLNDLQTALDNSAFAKGSEDEAFATDLLDKATSDPSSSGLENLGSTGVAGEDWGMHTAAPATTPAPARDGSTAPAATTDAPAAADPSPEAATTTAAPDAGSVAASQANGAALLTEIADRPEFPINGPSSAPSSLIFWSEVDAMRKDESVPQFKRDIMNNFADNGWPNLPGKDSRGAEVFQNWFDEQYGSQAPTATRLATQLNFMSNGDINAEAMQQFLDDPNMSEADRAIVGAFKDDPNGWDHYATSASGLDADRTASRPQFEEWYNTQYLPAQSTPAA